MRKIDRARHDPIRLTGPYNTVETSTQTKVKVDMVGFRDELWFMFVHGLSVKAVVFKPLRFSEMYFFPTLTQNFRNIFLSDSYLYHSCPDRPEQTADTANPASVQALHNLLLNQQF